MTDNRCEFRKRDGTRCRARKLRGSRWCWFHDPAKADRRSAAQRAGGQHGRSAVLPADTPLRQVRSAGDVIELVGETINQVRTGTLDPKVGNCVGYLAAVTLKAVQQGDVEQRLAALETAVRAAATQKQLLNADPADVLSVEAETAAEGKLA